MADKLEDLVKKAVQGNQNGGKNNSISTEIKLDKPMSLKHSYDGMFDKPMICNEGTDLSNNDGK